jgi:hypothetical protein
MHRIDRLARTQAFEGGIVVTTLLQDGAHSIARRFSYWDYSCVAAQLKVAGRCTAEKLQVAAQLKSCRSLHS